MIAVLTYLRHTVVMGLAEMREDVIEGLPNELVFVYSAFHGIDERPDVLPKGTTDWNLALILVGASIVVLIIAYKMDVDDIFVFRYHGHSCTNAISIFCL